MSSRGGAEVCRGAEVFFAHLLKTAKLLIYIHRVYIERDIKSYRNYLCTSATHYGSDLVRIPGLLTGCNTGPITVPFSRGQFF